MTEQERPRTVPYAVWAVAGITELQRMQLEQHGYHIVRTEDVEAARTEGRQQAVTVERLGEAIGKVIPRNEPVPYWLTANLHRIVAGLNASESPPTGHIVGDRFVSDESFDAAIPLGDASELPLPTEDIAGDLWHQREGWHSMGDASESGQPPEASDD